MEAALAGILLSFQPQPDSIKDVMEQLLHETEWNVTHWSLCKVGLYLPPS